MLFNAFFHKRSKKCLNHKGCSLLRKFSFTLWQTKKIPSVGTVMGTPTCAGQLPVLVYPYPFDK